ncbi:MULTISPECIES: hypothetical protein [unclassified Cupriavidus]|uniref:hypothetical protein n=1 Tax=Cupriavidus sp. H19C3 TaxID=3241603 RepID=UPI003BF8C085
MSLSATSFVVNASPAAPAMGVVCAASARLRDIVVSPVVAGVGAVGLMGLMGVVGMSRVVGVSPPPAARQVLPLSPPLSPPLAPPRG